MKIWFYEFADFTILRLYKAGLSIREIWALEAIHGKLIESGLREVTE